MDTPNDKSPDPDSALPSPPSPTERRGGVGIEGGEVHAGRDIVGGDVVTLQRTGFSAQEVQRIILVVGILVFATAACFFVLGATVSVTVLATLNRPIVGESDPKKAELMQSKLDQIQALGQGDSFQAQFTEDEVSSYFRFILGRDLGIGEGKVRFMDQPGQLAIGGKLNQLGGVEFAAQLNLVKGRAHPVEISAAWIKVLPTQGTGFGWIPVTPLAKNLEDQLNARLLGRVWLTQVTQIGAQGAEVGRRVLNVWGTIR